MLKFIKNRGDHLSSHEHESYSIQQAMDLLAED